MTETVLCSLKHARKSHYPTALYASRAASWRVTLSMRRRDRRTHRRTDGQTPDRYTTLSVKRGERNKTS